MLNLPLLAALSRPRARWLHAALVALVATIIALWPAVANAHVDAHVDARAPDALRPPASTTASRPADSRLALNGQIVYYTFRLALREPRLGSGKCVVGVRRTSDPGFLSIDEYRYFSPRTTLWGWPGQNPLRYRDPSGRDGMEDLMEFERLGGLDYLAGYGAGLLDNVPLYAGCRR